MYRQQFCRISSLVRQPVRVSSSIHRKPQVRFKLRYRRLRFLHNFLNNFLKEFINCLGKHAQHADAEVLEVGDFANPEQDWNRLRLFLEENMNLPSGLQGRGMLS